MTGPRAWLTAVLGITVRQTNALFKNPALLFPSPPGAAAGVNLGGFSPP